MRIGILSSVCNSHSGARAPIELGISLVKRGHKVFFFFMDKDRDGKTYQYLSEHNIEVIFLPIPSSFIDSIKISFKLSKIVKEKKIEVLSSHTIPTYHLGGVLSGKPVVFTYHGTQFNPLLEYVPPDKDVTFVLKILNLIGNLYAYLRLLSAVVTSKKLVSISEYVRKELKRLYFSDSSVIYWGTIPWYFEEVLPDSSVYKKEANEHIILTVSRITPYKGFHSLIEAFKSVSGNVTLVIVGSPTIPSYLSYLKKIADKRVKFLLNISDEQLLYLYKIADVYVSWDKYLFFGMPIMEAAYFGVPAVIMDFCAAREVIKDGVSGFVVKNKRSFIRRLKEIIENEELRRDLGLQAGKKAREEFDYKAVAGRYEEIFKEVVKL